jgi:hypothetical protein
MHSLWDCHTQFPYENYLILKVRFMKTFLTIYVKSSFYQKSNFLQEIWVIYFLEGDRSTFHSLWSINRSDFIFHVDFVGMLPQPYVGYFGLFLVFPAANSDV